MTHRNFLKLAGAAMGAGLAAQFGTPAEQALAATIGDPDAYLQGNLYGPSSAALTLISQLQNPQTVEVAQFYVQQPNGSGGYNQIEALGISNNGNVRLPGGSLSLDTGSITITGGNLTTEGITVNGTVDMGNQSLTNVAQIWGYPNTHLVLGGWQNIDLNAWNGDGSFRWWGGTGTPQVVMDPTGNVGIGTQTPASSLEIVGHIALWAGDTLRSASDFGNYVMPYEAGTGRMVLRTGATDRVSILYNGNVGIGTTNPQVALDIGGYLRTNSSLQIIRDVDGSGSNRPDQIYLQGATNANMKMYVGFDTVNKYGLIQALEETVAWRNIVLARDGGYVGIGTRTPASMLDVAGAISVNGAAAIDSSGGALKAYYSP